MPLFMHRHDLSGVTAEQVAQAHLADLGMGAKFGVQFLAYWFDAEQGEAFCLRSHHPAAVKLARATPSVVRSGHDRCAAHLARSFLLFGRAAGSVASGIDCRYPRTVVDR